MTTTTITFTRADLEFGRYVGDSLRNLGPGPRGAKCTVRISEADAQDLWHRVTGGTVTMRVDSRQITQRLPGRRAVIERRDGRPEPERVEPYLYGNFTIASHNDRVIMITGHDNAGFTLESQCDRLASGLIAARVVQ